MSRNTHVKRLVRVSLKCLISVANNAKYDGTTPLLGRLTMSNRNSGFVLYFTHLRTFNNLNFERACVRACVSA